MDAAGSPKERLFSALDELFARQSALDVGIDTLLARAGVAKASLYHHFGSKDALVAAWLEQRQTSWFGYFDSYVSENAGASEPRAQIVAAFGFLEVWLARDDFVGCPFLTTFLQLKDPEHPAAKRARAYADALLGFFTTRLRALGSADAASRAQALVQLFLGAVVTSQLGVGSHAARSARRGAEAVLRARDAAARPRPPKP